MPQQFVQNKLNLGAKYSGARFNKRGTKNKLKYNRRGPVASVWLG